MTTRKIKVTEEEAQEEKEIVTGMLSEDNLSLYDEYFSANLDASGLAYPRNHYDFIVFNAIEHQKYYYGTVAAHTLDALKNKGYLIFNHNGSVLNMEEVINIIEFVGLKYREKESKNGYYVFQKVVK